MASIRQLVLDRISLPDLQGTTADGGNLSLQKLGVSFNGGPQNKHHSILGCILGSPYLWKLPYMLHLMN